MQLHFSLGLTYILSESRPIYSYVLVDESKKIYVTCMLLFRLLQVLSLPRRGGTHWIALRVLHNVHLDIMKQGCHAVIMIKCRNAAFGVSVMYVHF